MTVIDTKYQSQRRVAMANDGGKFHMIKSALPFALILPLLACSPADKTKEYNEALAVLEQAVEAHNKAMELVDENRRNTFSAAHIIVYGQVLKDEDEIYLQAIEYLKAPDDIRQETRLSLGDGIEPGRNIPVLNGMALTIFDENMTILDIDETARGSQYFESWRNYIRDQNLRDQNL